MTSRRDFIRYSAVTALAAAAPVRALAAHHKGLAARRIPGSDESLPIVGLGNSGVFREADLTAARSLLEIFLGRGGRYVDAGGASRGNVGHIARDLGASDDVFIGNYLDPKNTQAMRDEAGAVAKSQGKAALDLIQTRDPDAYRKHIDDYRRLQDDGLARYIGVARSGRQSFDAIMQLIEDGLVDFVQVNYSIMEPDAEDRLLPLAMDKGVAVCINRPFINGNYFGIIRGRELPDWAAEFDCESWAQFSLKFILAHPAVNCVLTETSNPKHAIDNLGAGFGRLPDAATRQRMRTVIQDLM